MDHVWDLSVYRMYSIFVCVICQFTWNPGQERSTCEEVLSEMF